MFSAWFAVVGVRIYGDKSIVWTRYALVIIPDLIIITYVALFWCMGNKKNSLRSSEKSWWRRSMLLNLTIALCLLYRSILFALMSLYLLTPLFSYASFSVRTTLIV